LLERPRLAAFPLEVVAPEVTAKRLLRTLLEHVPCADKVQRWVSRSQAADIQDADETAVAYKQIAGNEIAMCHHVGRDRFAGVVVRSDNAR